MKSLLGWLLGNCKEHEIKFSLILTWLVDSFKKWSNPILVCYHSYIFPPYSYSVEVLFQLAVCLIPFPCWVQWFDVILIDLSIFPLSPLLFSSLFFLFLSIIIRMMSHHRSTVTPGWPARFEHQSWCMYLKGTCRRLRMCMAMSPTHTSHHWRWVLLPLKTPWKTASMVFHMSFTHLLSDAIMSRRKMS